MNQYRKFSGGFGTANAAVAAGGGVYPATPWVAPYTMAATACTEEYNGVGWSTGGSMGGNGRNLGSSSGKSAYTGWVVGGRCGGGSPGQLYTNLCNTVEYNGTSWSNSGCMITHRQQAAGGGTQNAGIIFGAGIFNTGPSFNENCCTEEYNGVSWSSGAAVYNNGSGAGGGCQDDFRYLGGSGFIGSRYYNGTTWSNGPNAVNTFIRGGGDSPAGSSDIIAGGGTNAPTQIGNRYCYNVYEGGIYDTYRSTNAKNVSVSDYPGVVGGRCCTIVFGGAPVPSSASPTNPVVCTEIFTG